MRLLIGGAYQGKTQYLHTMFAPEEIADGEVCSLTLPEEIMAINHLHILVRRWCDAGYDPVASVLALIDRTSEMLFVCDELGCGVVPFERIDREWRDKVGDVCMALASKADRVERMFCGIIQTIKGEEV